MLLFVENVIVECLLHYHRFRKLFHCLNTWLYFNLNLANST